jgi:hypothetical protein
MSYSENFEAALSNTLNSLFQGAVEIDTQPLGGSDDMNALAETWLKAGESLSHHATTTEDRFAIFQIQSMGLLMEAVSCAADNTRKS